MAISRRRKEKEVEKLQDRFSRIKSVVLTNYQGLTVSEISELRKNLREEKIDFGISKNTLVKVALKTSDLTIDPEFFQGPIAIAYGYDDEVMPAKLVYNFAKEHEKLEILGGIFEKSFIDKEQVEKLAQIPGKEELLAKFVGCLAGPMVGIQNVLQGNIRGLVSVLSQYKESKA